MLRSTTLPATSLADARAVPLASPVPFVRPVGRVLEPESIVIVGASADARAFGQFVLQNLERFAYEGGIHLVSRSSQTINGRACVSQIDALPEGIDLAVLCIPEAGVLDAVRALGAKRVGAAVIFASGYAETGAAGRAKQQALTDAAQAGGVVLIGPNCMGLTNFAAGVPVTFEAVEPYSLRSPSASASLSAPQALPHAHVHAQRRGIGIIAQSGAMAANLRDAFIGRGEPITAVVSTGNEAMLGIEDYLAWFIADARTGALALYAEQIRRPQTFLHLARQARAAGKPIVLLMPGKSARAQEAAQSHTGALAGDHATASVLLAREGVVVVASLDELFDTTTILAHFPQALDGAGAMGIAGATGLPPRLAAGAAGAANAANTANIAGSASFPRPQVVGTADAASTASMAGTAAALASFLLPQAVDTADAASTTSPTDFPPSQTANTADTPDAASPATPPGTAILTASGAVKNILLDFAEDIGLALPRLTDATLAKLTALLPDFAVADNPLDYTTIGVRNPGLIGELIDTVLADPNIGSLVLAIVVGPPIAQRDKAAHLVPALARATKPAILTVMGDDLPLEPFFAEAIAASGVPFFRSPERALRACAHVAAYGEALQRAARADANAMNRAHGAARANARPSVNDAVKANDMAGDADVVSRANSTNIATRANPASATEGAHNATSANDANATPSVHGAAKANDVADDVDVVSRTNFTNIATRANPASAAEGARNATSANDANATFSVHGANGASHANATPSVNAMNRAHGMNDTDNVDNAHGKTVSANATGTATTSAPLAGDANRASGTASASDANRAHGTNDTDNVDNATARAANAHAPRAANDAPSPNTPNTPRAIPLPGPVPPNGIYPEYRGKDWLARAGLPVPRGRLAATLADALKIADEIGYPVVLKAQASALPHKSDVGGVVVGLADAQALRAGWDRLHASVAAHRPDLKLDGVLVEAMGTTAGARGLELVIGAKRDPAWGPVVLVGLGGVFIEVLRDVRLIPADLAEDDIVVELRRLKAAALFDGVRGAARVDVRAIAQAVAALGAQMCANPEIVEIDVNPLLASAQRVLALDALLVCRTGDGREAHDGAP